MKKQSVASAAVIVALTSTLGVFVVAILRGVGTEPAVANAVAGLAVAASAIAGLMAIRPGSHPRADASPEAQTGRWIHTTGAGSLQVVGAATWLIADGPWPPALAALCIGTGLLAARELPPLPPGSSLPANLVDIRDGRMIALVPGLETPEELARLRAHQDAMVRVEEQRRLRILELRRQADPNSEPPIILTSRQLLP